MTRKMVENGILGYGRKCGSHLLPKVIHVNNKIPLVSPTPVPSNTQSFGFLLPHRKKNHRLALPLVSGAPWMNPLRILFLKPALVLDAGCISQETHNAMR